MVMLRAPDPRVAAAYYVETLRFRLEREAKGEVLLEGYGFQLVFTPGPGAQRTAAPPADDAELSVLVPMEVMEHAWNYDRAERPEVHGPILGETGTFVYVALDPAGNAVELMSALPGSGFGGRRPTTQRLRRID